MRIYRGVTPYIGAAGYQYSAYTGGTNISGINAAGDLVGQAENSSGPQAYTAFLQSDNGVRTSIAPESGYTSSFATAINAGGQVAGCSEYTTADGLNPRDDHGGLSLQSGRAARPWQPGGGSSVATSINGAGTVAGYSTTSSSSGGATHAFVYANGQMTDLGPLAGFANTFAVGINDPGQVVGFAATGAGGPGAI